MSTCQLINGILRRAEIIAFFLFFPLFTGCSDSRQAALDAGAKAQSLLEGGRIAEARKVIQNAVSDRDDIADLQLLRGRIELAAGSPRTAFRAYSDALALDSSNPEALLAVAQLGLQVGQSEESEDAADRLLTLDPNQKGALLVKGVYNIVRHKFDDALANADAILKAQPNDEGAVILKARALSLLGRQDEAIKLVEGTKQVSGESKGIAITLLELHRARNEGEEMVPVLERLRALTPDDRRLDVDEADTLYKLGQSERARAILLRSMVATDLGVDDAEAIVRLWAEYDPTPYNASTLRAFTQKAGQPARKVLARYFIDTNHIDVSEAILAGSPANTDLRAIGSRLTVRRGKASDALKVAESILASDTTHCDALIAKAEASLAMGQADQAIIAGQYAVANCPHETASYQVLVTAHTYKHDRNGVSVAYRDAFENNDQDSRLARSYSDWLVATGQEARALAIARRLNAAAPSLVSGWQLYLDLCKRQPAARCTDDAQAGLTKARRLFGVDYRTGEAVPISLLSRIGRR